MWRGQHDHAQALERLQVFAGEQLGQSPGVPVYLYGTAHSHARPLPRLRRELGYFAGAPAGESVVKGAQLPGYSCQPCFINANGLISVLLSPSMKWSAGQKASSQQS